MVKSQINFMQLHTYVRPNSRVLFVRLLPYCIFHKDKIIKKIRGR